MKRIVGLIIVMALGFLCAVPARAQLGIYAGVQGGYSSQKASFKDLKFNRDTTFLYGVRAGVKVLMFALEFNYFQAAHNLDPTDLTATTWKNREVDYSFVGLNLKYIFSVLVVQPYLTAGVGYYSANIDSIDKDKDKGYNVGLGVELRIKKIGITAEAKYHHVTLDIDNKDFKIGGFTLTGGINIHF